MNIWFSFSASRCLWVSSWSISAPYFLQALGGRGEINEVMVRTWANPESTVRPDIAVLVREETDEEWQTDTDPVGTISVGVSSVTGIGTPWSRYIALGPQTGGVAFTLPWLIDQCDLYVEDASQQRVALDYTKLGDFEFEIDDDLDATEKLYVNPGPARPFVRGRAGDYIFTEYGYHRITVVNTATDVELDWYPPQQTAGTYIPAQEIPAGGKKGDGKLIFGLGRGFDQIMLQVLIIPHGNVDATGAKITSLELGYAPTGPEMKTDSGG